jgi:outer membrane lipoprotein LolB
MFRRAFLAASVVWLAGCAAIGPFGSPPPPERPPRDSIQAFGLVGRLSLRNGAESFSAHIDWNHFANGSERLLVTSPLGQGLAELGVDARGAWLITAEQKEYSATDLDDLSQQVFGARLPLSRLPSWVLGRTDGTAIDRLVRDEHDRPQGFVEAGWIILYGSYESDAANALPAMVRVTRDPLDIRLKVDQWNLAPR